MLHPQAAAQGFQINVRRVFSHQRLARPRVVLATRHGRGPVVENQHRAVPAVVHHVQQPGDARMHERRIADNRHDLLGFLFRQHLGKPHRIADPRAHTDTGIHVRNRRKHPERVTTDVPHHPHLEFLQNSVGGAVGTAGTKHRRARRNVLGRVGRRMRDPEDVAHTVRVQFPHLERRRFGLNIQPHRPQPGFQIRIEFLEDKNALEPGGKLPDLLFRQRVQHPQLQNRGLGQHFAHILIGHPGGHDPPFAVGPLRLRIDRRRLSPLRQFRGPFVDNHLTALGVSGNHDIFPRIAVQSHRTVQLNRFRRHDNTLAVADTRGHAQNHRRVKILADLQRLTHKLIGFLAVGGFKHRHLGERAVVAVVLLVLRAMHARVVRRHDHDPALGPGIGQGKKRIGGDVQPHVLHGHQNARAAKRGANPHLEGHLFVRRPLGVDFRMAGRDGFQNFRTRSPGVSRRQAHPPVQGAQGDRLVAGKKKFGRRGIRLLHCEKKSGFYRILHPVKVGTGCASPATPPSVCGGSYENLGEFAPMGVETPRLHTGRYQPAPLFFKTFLQGVAGSSRVKRRGDGLPVDEMFDLDSSALHMEDSRRSNFLRFSAPGRGKGQ